jgi:hypothetical protein
LGDAEWPHQVQLKCQESLVDDSGLFRYSHHENKEQGWENTARDRKCTQEK